MITVTSTKAHPLCIRATFRPKLRTTHFTPQRTCSPSLSIKTEAKTGTHKAEKLNFDDNDEEEDEDGFVAFPKMKEWSENRPKGFGEGTVYDTHIENTLEQEILLSRKAHAFKVKDTAGSHKDTIKAPEVVPSGIPVRLGNLPKKKNVHRDLKSAFQGIPGIAGISPAVSGSRKTRDPICKGFGFVYFKTQEHALRFVQIFSRQSITFGKVQKQIKCEMVDSRSSNSLKLKSGNVFGSQKLPYLEFNEYSMGGESAEVLTSELDDIDEDSESKSELKVNSSNDVEPLMDSETDSFPAKQKSKTKGNNKKKPVAKQKEVQKVAIPGSAKRLKVKEKSMLAGVLSKYGAKPAAKG